MDTDLHKDELHTDDPRMDSELTTYMGRVLAHRAQLRESADAVIEALAHPIGREGEWRGRVRAALSELDHDFAGHVELTEAQGGLYDRISRAAPRLSTSVDRLRDEHIRYKERIGELIKAIEDSNVMRDLVAFREDVTQLIGQLIRHRQKGADLIYEAYEVDLGGSE